MNNEISHIKQKLKYRRFFSVPTVINKTWLKRTPHHKLKVFDIKQKMEKDRTLILQET